MDIPTVIELVIGLFVFAVLIGNYMVYKKLSSAKAVSFKFSVAPILILSSAPFLLLTLPIFAVYRQIVNLILIIKYRSKYWGLLDGRDAVYNFENKNPALFLFVVKYDSNRSQNFYDAVKETGYKALYSNTNPKFFGAVRTFSGYSYLLQDEMNFDDCFQKLEFLHVPTNKEELLAALSEYTVLPLPRKREGLWDVFVSTKPVSWIENMETNKNKYFPVLLRVNHTLTDAQHLFKGIIKLFADSNCPAFIQQNSTQAFTDRPSLSDQPVYRFLDKFGKGFLFYARQICITCLTPSVGLVNSLLMIDDFSLLHGLRPTYRKHLFLSTEEFSCYIQVVKKIKKRIPGATFEDVCFTALAASFQDYFQKNSTTVPDYITVEVPAVPPTLIKAGEPKDREVFCRNRLTFAVRRLPIRFEAESKTPLVKILEKIKREGKLIRHSLEFEANYMILKLVCHLIPATILRPHFDVVHNCTALLSNIPGPSLITVMGGCEVQAIIPWAANRGYTGVGVGFVTYDERLQITLVVDKCVVSTRDQAKGLIENFYKYLDLLDQEIMNISDENVINT